MKKLFFIATFFLVSQFLMAQYSADATNPLPLCNVVSTQKAVAAVKDNMTTAKGSFVFWMDNRSSSFEIYGQRLDSNGVILWEPGGRKIVSASLGITDFRVIRWRSGMLLTYTVSQDSVKCIYLNTKGKNIWAAPSLIACKNFASSVIYVSGGAALNSFGISNGAAFTYNITYVGGSSAIGYNRIDFNGVPAFGNNAKAYTLSGYDYRSASDRADGLYLLSKGNGIGSTMTINRIDINGLQLWGSGLEITNGGAIGFGGNISMNADASNALYVTWDGSNGKIYHSKILSTGGFAWVQPQIALSATATANRCFAAMGKNDSSYITWQETISGTNYVMMQKAGKAGGLGMPAGGKKIDTANGYYNNPKIAFDNQKTVCVFTGIGSTVAIAAQTIKPNNGFGWSHEKLLCDSYLKWNSYSDYVVLDGASGCNTLFWSALDGRVYGAKTCTIPSLQAMEETETVNNLIVNTAALTAQVYPNPATTKAVLTISGSNARITVAISDRTGRMLWQQTGISAKQVNLSVHMFQAGLYFVTVTDGKDKEVVKLIIQ